MIIFVVDVFTIILLQILDTLDHENKYVIITNRNNFSDFYFNYCNHFKIYKGTIYEVFNSN